MGIERRTLIRTIEPINERVLLQLARLDVPQLNRPFRTPANELLGDEFRAIVEPDGLRLPAPRHDLLQHADHTFS